MAKFIDGSGVERVIPKLTLGAVAKIKKDSPSSIELDKFFTSPETAEKLLFQSPTELACIVGLLCDIPQADFDAFIDAIDGDALDRIREALLETVADFCLPLHARGTFKARIPAFLANPGSFLSDGSTTGSDSPAPSA